MLSTPQQQAEALLNALDPLPYSRRMRELVSWARESTELRPVLDELDVRGPSERGIAVVAAAAGRDTDWIAGHIADPDSFVRRHALRVADSLQVPDDVYASALVDASEAVRRDLLEAVARGRRKALADRLVDTVRADWGDTQAARLLPGCSSLTVARLLPELFHAVRGWQPLGKRHPGALLDVVEGELTGLPESLRETWWRRYARAVEVTVHADPLRVLELVERRGPTELPHELVPHLGTFANVAPAQVLRMMLDGVYDLGRWFPRPTALRRLVRSGAAELAPLGGMLAERSDHLAQFVKALPPAERHAFYTASIQGRGDAHTDVDSVILEALPRSCVAEEARRMADAARERGSLWSTVLLAESFLPVTEVRDRLVEATRRPLADDRAEAWPLLIRNAARSGRPDAVTAVLEDMARLRNEQDPVRAPALHALADTHPALFTEDAEPHLDRIAADAVEARDSSPWTRQELSRLALSVLREHAAGRSRELVNWALRTLVRISGSTGGADLGRLDRTLRRGQEHQVYEALRPWIEAGAEKADYSLTFALARAVGRRAAGMAELQELLWQAIRYGNDTTVHRAVELWLEPPATRDERVARILAQDASAGALSAVCATVTRRRTDLLDVLLADTPPYGRFLTKGSPWYVPVDGYVRRWAPRQQRAVLRQLTETAADAGLPDHTRATAIARAAVVPSGGPELIRRWADAPNVVLAEAALVALARIDRPGDVVPELLAHAGGDRARVAVYAATHASLHVPPSVLAGQLREVLLAPGAKVTGRKEAARLAAARLPVPQAAELLAEVYADAHRDVRAACVTAAGALLADDRAWTLLRDAARGEPVLRTAVLRTQPLDLAEPYRERYARLVREASDTDDPQTATLAFEALADWTPWSPDAPLVLAGATTDLTNRETWRAAADGLVTAAVGAAHGVRGLEQALTELAEAEEGPDAEERRDRPARRRVEHLVELLGLRAWSAPGPVRAAALAAGEVLARYDAFVPQAAALLAGHLDLDSEPHAVDTALDRLAVLTDGRPALTGSIARALSARMQRQTRQGDPDALLPTVHRLTEHGGFAEGLLAAALTDALGQRTGWSAPWREQLRSLRRHRAPDVRDAALARTTAFE
ncbi:hypothetical protein [Streptomyces cavernae]|uniref:hypothetical protein n=1 Tax=Streptomyces cavernae TaxID=2259034 RepID=UPI000FEBC181|nr:hypothetical protein [Streptomyces cavernae]